VPLTEEVKAAALQAQRRLRDAWGDKVKWVEESNMHITLKFLGQTEVGRLAQVEGILGRVASEFDPFQVGTGGVGGFPSLERPRVVWYGLTEGGDALAAVADAVEQSLAELGFEVEGRFHPHVTLGRVRRESGGQGLGRLADAEKEGAPDERQGPSMRIERYVLMESILSRSGPTYRVLREFPLGARGLSEET